MTLLVLCHLSYGASGAFEETTELDSEAQVSVARDLPFRSHVPVIRQSRNELKAKRLADLAAQVDLEKRHGLERALMAFGFFPGVKHPLDRFFGYYSSQVAGEYRPENKALFLIDGGSSRADKVTILHELDHALVDQHFDLLSLIKRVEGQDSDHALAMRALSEGDAVYVMYEAILGMDLTLYPSSENLGQSQRRHMPLSMRQLAPLLREELLFPYLDGFTFVLFGKTHGGWRAINAAYSDLPSSTEQILHPERYFTNRDEPTPVQLPALDSELGSSWRKIADDTLGEFGIRALFETILRSDGQAVAYADGWDGDRFIAYERQEDVCLTWMTVWDSSTEADEFWIGAHRLLKEKSPQAQVLIDEPSLSMYAQKDGRVVIIEQRADRVLVIDGAPYTVATDLYDQLWAP